MRITVVVVASLLVAHSARAEVTNMVCLSGTCDISHPVYVNVYWDSSQQQWNQDIAATDASATIARIDAATQAVIKSGFFHPLDQYQVQSATMAPSIVGTSCGSPAATVVDSIFSSSPISKVAAFASCVMRHHPELDPKRTILNVFFPPQVTGGSGWCPGAGGSHNEYYAGASAGIPTSFIPVETVIMPTNKACKHPQFHSIIAALTHEMVEAATDPFPDAISGWGNGGQEIADICKPLPGYTANFLCLDSDTTHPFPALPADASEMPCAQVHSYWSNRANGCVNGLNAASFAHPAALTPTVCGTGAAMRITIGGSFGAAPFDLASSGQGGDQTLFLQGYVDGKSKFSVGGFQNFPASGVGFGKITWSSSSIVIEGFDDRYGSLAAPPTYPGALVVPGDQISIMAWSPASGQLLGTALVIAPAPTTISDLNAGSSSSSPSSGWALIDEPGAITGRLVDSGRCAVGGLRVTVSASDATFPEGKIAAATTSDGLFALPYIPTGVAGKRTVEITAPVTASVSVNVHPVAIQLDGARGASSGGQTLTLHGDGFSKGATKVLFRAGSKSAEAKSVNVSDPKTLTLITPPSPFGGDGAGSADVVVSVSGLYSTPLSYDYFPVDVPIMTFIPGCNIGVGAVSNALLVDMYRADGSESTAKVDLAAGYGAFDNPAGGSPLLSTTVTPGLKVELNGSGPVTATSTVGAKQSVTQSFKHGAPQSCGPDLHFFKLSYQPWDRGAPVESGLLDGILAGDGGGVGWKVAKEAFPTTLTFSSTDKGAVKAAAGIQVVAFGLGDLRAAVRKQPGVYLRAAVGKQVSVLGPSLAMSSKKELGGRLFATPANLIFALPARLDASQVRLVHSTPGGAWMETPSSIKVRGGRSAAIASVQDSGTYALVRVGP